MPTGVFQQAHSAILDNYADVIEGGNGWASGTSYRGIPGTQPNDPELKNGNESSVTASGNGTTTTVVYASGAWASDRWVKNDTPGFFLLCTSATNAANVNAARRITGWALATTTFTVDAFPAATTSADEFTVLQGFKRLPNGLEIDSDEPTVGADAGFDRFFQLRMQPGTQIEYFGGGVATYQTELELSLRFLKHGREHDAIAAVLENMAIIRQIICKGASPDHRDGTYTRALIPTGSGAEIIADDINKVVVRDSFTLLYRIDLTYN